MHQELRLLTALAVHVVSIVTPVPLIHHRPVNRVQPVQSVKLNGKERQPMAVREDKLRTGSCNRLCR